jgi:hypothetical protein
MQSQNGNCDVTLTLRFTAGVEGMVKAVFISLFVINERYVNIDQSNLQHMPRHSSGG